MEITRRVFLAGSASLIGATAAGALPPIADEPQLVVKLTGPVFSRSALRLADPEWFHVCAAHSEWHFDAASFAGRVFIRHRLTGLAYLLFIDDAGAPVVQQLAPECCPCRDDLDPDRIIGHAAWYVATHAAWLLPAWPGRRVFLRYRMFEPDPFLDPILEDAPPIPIRPLTEAVIQT